MYQIKSQTVVDAIESDCRTFRAVLEFHDTSYSGSDVGKITIEHAQSEDDTIQIGGVLSRHAEIRLHTRRIPSKGAQFDLYLYLLDWGGAPTDVSTYKALKQWLHGELAAYTHAQIRLLGKYKDGDGVPLDGLLIPMGEYLTSKVQIRGGEVTLECYDRLGTDKVYTPGIAFPADSWEVVEDVISQLGIRGRKAASGGYLKTASGQYVLTASGKMVLTSAEYSFTIDTAPPNGTTCRCILGWIAAMYGGNGILDRNGMYTTMFANSGSVVLKNSRINEPELSETEIQIRGIRCTVGENNVLEVLRSQEVDPEDSLIVEFDCPYMTQERLDAIWRRLRQLKWRPGNVTERMGDPRHDLGDRLGVSTSNGRATLIASSVTFRFDGGLQAEHESCGNTEEG